MNRFYLDEGDIWITDGETSMNLRLPGESAYRFARVIHDAKPGGKHVYSFGPSSRLEFERIANNTTLLTVHDWDCFVLEWNELLQFVTVLKCHHRRYMNQAVKVGKYGC